MKEFHWLEWEDILSIHRELLHRFGGLDGLREPHFLDSAIHRPLLRSQYGKSQLFELAASYAHGIVNNHPFLDGNKRTGFMAAYTFLGINGYRLEAPEEEAVLQTLALAAGQCQESEYAAWLERNTKGNSGHP